MNVCRRNYEGSVSQVLAYSIHRIMITYAGKVTGNIMLREDSRSPIHSSCLFFYTCTEQADKGRGLFKVSIAKLLILTDVPVNVVWLGFLGSGVFPEWD